MNPKRLLFVVLIALMPFYFHACETKDYAAGFPLFFISSQVVFSWSQIIIALVVNAIFSILLGFILSRWFRSTTYQKRAGHFTLSNWICFIYVCFQFIWSWIFLGHTLLFPEAKALPNFLFELGSIPIMYTLAYMGAFIVETVAGIFGASFNDGPIAEYARASFPLALFNLYWLSYILTLLFLWIKKKIRTPTQI